MRDYGALRNTELTPVPPDTVGTVVISSAGAVVAADWPALADLVLFSGTVDFYANLRSTGARVPSTNSVGSTNPLDLNELNPGVRQLSNSTGYSIAGPSSGIVTVSFWSR